MGYKMNRNKIYALRPVEMLKILEAQIKAILDDEAICKLKPCPFCNCADIEYDILSEHVYCTSCGVMTFEQKWNIRPIEEALQDKINNLN